MKEISEVCSELKQVAKDAKSQFDSLSAEQLNWGPGGKEWSIAQCFDHLIRTHSLYFPLFERLAVGNANMSFWEKSSPFSKILGKQLIKRLDPKNLKKMKTTGKAKPSSSKIEGDIIDRFVEHQQQLIDAIKKLPSDLDAEKQIITSPLLRAITYSLDDAFTFVPLHCRRHFDQAKRIVEMTGFPA